MSAIGMLAAGAALNGINNIFSHISSNYDRQENARFNEEAAENAYSRQKEMYNMYYSPSALLKQYKEAGLSPSLMFGGTPGQGGTSAPMGAGAAGSLTPFMPISMMEAAQVHNINAQTEKTKAETKTIEGTREPEIAKLWAETGNTIASTNYTNAQTEAQNIDNYILQETADFQIQQAEYQARIFENDVTRTLFAALDQELQYNFNNENYVNNSKIVEQTLNNMITDNLMKKAQINLTNAEKEKLSQDIKQAWWQLKLAAENLVQNATSIKNQKEYWDNAIQNATRTITNDKWRIATGTIGNILSGAVGATILRGITRIGGKAVTGDGQ